MPSIRKSVNFFLVVHVFFFLLSLLLQHWVHFVNFYNIIILSITDLSLCTNPLARSPGQVKLDSDMWKLWKNLFELVENLSKFGFRASRWKKIKAKIVTSMIRFYLHCVIQMYHPLANPFFGLFFFTFFFFFFLLF